MERKTITVVFRVPPAVAEKLARLAQAARRTRSDVLRLILEQVEEVR